MFRIGIYGGAFSPIHRGHIQSARAFMEQMWLDILFVIPSCGRSCDKNDMADVSSADRLHMCELAFKGIEGVIVSDIEIRRGDSYTVNTLRELCTDPSNRYFLLCGSDKILTLDTWKGADDIFKICYPVYVRREHNTEIDAALVAKISEYKQKYGKNTVKLTLPIMEISSHEIRERLACGEDVSSLLTPEVEMYIRERGLYGC